jgi:ribonucleotide synthetase-like protein
VSSSNPGRGAEPEGRRVGVLGAGQLGRMLALAGAPLGLRFLFVDPAAGPPAADLGEHLALPRRQPGRVGGTLALAEHPRHVGMQQRVT